MNSEIDAMKYYMAAEKTMNMIYTIENALEYMDEFEIKPDENVKLALVPIIDKLKKWTDK